MPGHSIVSRAMGVDEDIILANMEVRNLESVIKAESFVRGGSRRIIDPRQYIIETFVINPDGEESPFQSLILCEVFSDDGHQGYYHRAKGPNSPFGGRPGTYELRMRGRSLSIGATGTSLHLWPSMKISVQRRDGTWQTASYTWPAQSPGEHSVSATWRFIYQPEA